MTTKMTTKTNILRTTVLILITVFITASGAAVWEGSGTQADPYQIDSGQDIEEIDPNTGTATNSSQLDAYYEVVQDIDYSGNTFTTISGTFTGNFDGQEYVIQHDDNSLFSDIDNNATVANITFKDYGMSGDSPALVGTIRNATVKNIKIKDSLNLGGADQYLGVLSGSINPGSGGTSYVKAVKFQNVSVDQADSGADSEYTGWVAHHLTATNSNSINIEQISYQNTSYSSADGNSPTGYVSGEWDSTAGGITLTDLRFKNADFSGHEWHGYFNGEVTGSTSNDEVKNIIVVGTPSINGITSSDDDADWLMGLDNVAGVTSYAGTSSGIYYDNNNINSGDTDLSTTSKATSDIQGSSAVTNLGELDFNNIWKEVDGDYPILRSLEEFNPSYTLTSPDGNTFDWNNVYDSNNDDLTIPFDFEAIADNTQPTNFNLEVRYPNGTVKTETGKSVVAGGTWDIDGDVLLTLVQAGDYEWYINGNNFEENSNSTTKTFTIQIDKPTINTDIPSQNQQFNFGDVYNSNVDKMDVPFNFSVEASQDEPMNSELRVTYPNGTTEVATGQSQTAGSTWNVNDDIIIDTNETGQYEYELVATGVDSGNTYTSGKTQFEILDASPPTFNLVSPDGDSFDWGDNYDENANSVLIPFDVETDTSPDEPMNLELRVERPDGQEEVLIGKSFIANDTWDIDGGVSVPDKEGVYDYWVRAEGVYTGQVYISNSKTFELNVDDPNFQLYRPVSGEKFEYTSTDFEVPLRFNITASEDEPMNFELRIERPDGINIVETGKSQTAGSSWTLDDDIDVDTQIGTWSYYIWAEGVQTGTTYTSNTETFETDLENEAVFNLTSPAPDTEFETVSGQKTNVTFEYDVIAKSQGEVQLYIDGNQTTTHQYNNTLTEQTYTYSKDLEEGDHDWYLRFEYDDSGTTKQVDSNAQAFSVVTNPAEEIILPIIGQIGSIMNIFKANLGTGGLLAVSTIVSLFAAGITYKFVRLVEITMAVFGASFLVFTIAGFVPPAIAFAIIVVLILVAAGLMRSKTTGGL